MTPEEEHRIQQAVTADLSPLLDRYPLLVMAGAEAVVAVFTAGVKRGIAEATAIIGGGES